eukprot:456544_1
MDDNETQELLEIMNNKLSLFDYDILCRCFQLLAKLIPSKHEVSDFDYSVPHIALNAKLCNETLYELLALMNIKNIDTNGNDGLIGYGEFLIDLLCNLEKITGSDQAQQFKLNINTENEIMRRLFAVLSVSKNLIQQVEKENTELAEKIKQILSATDSDKIFEGNIEYAYSQENFNEIFDIVAPLISEFDAKIYKDAINAVNIKDFFKYFYFDAKQFKPKKYPILSNLQRQSERFFDIHQLSDIANWIQIIHSKYMGLVSESSCKELKIKNVFEQCKLNKWGDQKEWEQQFEYYKNGINKLF